MGGLLHDDVVYVAILFTSIGFGHFYRRIPDVDLKKWIGTGVGVFVVFLVSGFHSLHPILCTLINAFIILVINKRKCHLYSFTFSFLHLLFFRTTVLFGIPYPPSHTNLIQMMVVLKMVGLAFEVNSSYMQQKSGKNDKEDYSPELKVSFMDIIHYSFNYVAVLTGPYYTYRTFLDALHLPFHKADDGKNATVQKLMSIPLFGAVYLITSYFWPVSYVSSEEFYDETSLLYRLWYVLPIFLIFRMRIYIGLTLSECVCTMAGVGAYPEDCESKPGNGPTTNLTIIKNINDNNDELSKYKYDYNTICNSDPYNTEVCLTLREAMKHWNMCIQYWMAVNIYKRFPSKAYRTVVTLFVSAFWHGVYAGYYFCIGGAPFYLPVEDLYVKAFITGEQKPSNVAKALIWMGKTYCLAYLGIAFQLLSVSKVFRFYNSVYHLGYITAGAAYAIGLIYLKKPSVRKPSKVD